MDGISNGGPHFQLERCEDRSLLHPLLIIQSGALLPCSWDDEVAARASLFLLSRRPFYSAIKKRDKDRYFIWKERGGSCVHSIPSVPPPHIHIIFIIDTLRAGMSPTLVALVVDYRSLEGSTVAFCPACARPPRFFPPYPIDKERERESNICGCLKRRTEHLLF